jgi:cell division protein FtsB
MSVFRASISHRLQESLNQQMDLYLRENDTLRRDNDILKREIERLRKTGQAAPSSNSRSGTLPSSHDLATSTPQK